MSQIDTQLHAALEDDVLPAPPARPKTAVVVGLLAGAALIFSFLAAYCGVNALVAADVMTRWQPGHDPRPRLLIVFAIVLMGLFSGVGVLARWLSGKQLSSIDAMENDDA
jgi:hypothetical protein